MTPFKIVVYAADVVAMLGCSEPSAYRLIRKIRKNHNKPPKTPISVAEFCEFTALKYEEVLFALNRGKTNLEVTVVKRDQLRTVSVG